MKRPVFDDINHKDLAHLRSYGYPMLRTFLATRDDDPKYHWHKRNLLGEIYENIIYEKLLAWAEQEELVEEFVLKGPYVKLRPKGRNGFTYSRSRQILYMSSNETIAEFDALFRLGESRYFVEITSTNSKPNIRVLRDEIRRKANLLRLVFSCPIRCWVVTPFERTTSLRTSPNLTVLDAPTYDHAVDLTSLPVSHGFPRITGPSSPRFLAVDGLSCQPFDYFDVLQSVHSRLSGGGPQSIRTMLPGIIRPYVGLIERIFVGKLAMSDFDTLVHRQEGGFHAGEVYFALKVVDLDEWSLVFYVLDANGRLFEMGPEPYSVKPVDPRKRSTKDVRHLYDKVKPLTPQQANEYLLNFSHN